MTDLTEKRLHEMMEAGRRKRTGRAREASTSKVGAFYKSFMDEARIEQLGAEPLASELAAVRAATTRYAIAALMGRNEHGFRGHAVQLRDRRRREESRRATSSTWGRADSACPIATTTSNLRSPRRRRSIEAYAAQLLKNFAWPEARTERKGDRRVRDRRSPSASWTKAEQRDPVKTYNPMTIPRAREARARLRVAGVPHEARASAAPRSVVVAEKTAFPKLAALFATTPVATLQAWLAFTRRRQCRAVTCRSRSLDASFEMRRQDAVGPAGAGRALEARRARGQRRRRARGRSRRSLRQPGLGGRAELYTERYFPPAAKARIEALVANLKAAVSRAHRDGSTG